jgi:hypothetical protein
MEGNSQLVAGSLAVGWAAIGGVGQAKFAPTTFTPNLKLKKKKRFEFVVRDGNSTARRSLLPLAAEKETNVRRTRKQKFPSGSLTNCTSCLQRMKVFVTLRRGPLVSIRDDVDSEEYRSPSPVTHIGESGWLSPRRPQMP